MINIKKSEIHALLVHYQHKKRRHRKSSQSLRMITELNALFPDLPHLAEHELTLEESHRLLMFLLKKRKQQDGRRANLAKKLEAKFGAFMDCFLACSRVVELTLSLFQHILNASDLEALPKCEEDVRPWLESQGLLSPFECAVKVLEEHGQLSSYLSAQNLIKLSLVNKGLFGLFKDPLSKRLCEYVVYGNLEKVKAIIEAQPALLMHAELVTDDAGREVHGTPLQLALAAKDVGFYSKDSSMVDVICNRLLRVFPDAQSIINQQMTEQFPEGYMRDYEARCERDKAAVLRFMQAIANEKNADVLQAAVNNFRKHFDDENKNRGVIRTGFHNNEGVVMDWFEALNRNSTSFNEKTNGPRASFLWQQAFYLLSYFTAVDGMLFARGMDLMWKAASPLRPRRLFSANSGMAVPSLPPYQLERSLTCYYGGRSFFALRDDPSFYDDVLASALVHLEDASSELDFNESRSSFASCIPGLFGQLSKARMKRVQGLIQQYTNQAVLAPIDDHLLPFFL
jgi:hypothetical protein